VSRCVRLYLSYLRDSMCVPLYVQLYAHLHANLYVSLYVYLHVYLCVYLYVYTCGPTCIRVNSDGDWSQEMQPRR